MSEDIWFTSDTHFAHKNIVWLGKGRPFETCWQMDAALIEFWNERVKPTDRVYHLGDFSFGTRSYTERVIGQLQGHKHFIRGNHDKVMDGLAHKFESYQQYKELKAGGVRLVLFHFPIHSWHKVANGAVHLHGHCHGNLPDDGVKARMDIGVDTHDYRPWHLDEVLEKMTPRIGKWAPEDHHS